LGINFDKKVNLSVPCHEIQWLDDNLGSAIPKEFVALGANFLKKVSLAGSGCCCLTLTKAVFPKPQATNVITSNRHKPF